MLVYNCKPADSVVITTPDNKIQLIVDTILERQSVKQVQLTVKSKGAENSYLLKPQDSFSIKVGSVYLEIKIGHTSPSKTTLYVGAVENAKFKFIKGNTPDYMGV